MSYQFMRFPGGKPKAVTFSYDDGVHQDIRFSETITKYGIKGTFNLNNDCIRGGNGFTEEHVRACLLEKGHEIAVHGARHRAEGTLRPIEGIKDILDNRLELEAKYGIIVRGMAYPDSGITAFSNGATYDAVKKYLTELDIAYARTLSGDNDRFMMPADWHAWMPTAHHDNPKIMEYIDKFLNLNFSSTANGARLYPRLFYLWGHSYEFDRNNNWEHLDEICEKLGGKEDTWYATNMEIYNYTKAYESLVYSADGKIIYNPSLFTIWLVINRVLYSINPGETLKL